MIKLENYKSGELHNDPTGYKYFMPTKINNSWVWDDPTISKLIEKASLRIGELNFFAEYAPNVDLFIFLHTTKEAVKSSKIEGTQTHMSEALMSEEDISPKRKDDWKEVSNYKHSLYFAIENLKNLPISSRMLKETHKKLLDSVRGKDKLPGEFRTSQNWIGGTSLRDAIFIPPHQNYIGELMSDLEKFIHNEEVGVPDLIKVAIAHYQFETIHPFLDGNGRIGRLLIPLFLIEKEMLTKPLLYLSNFFEKNRELYYQNLTLVRDEHDMKKWLKYFLTGITEAAEDSSKTLKAVLELQKKTEEKITKEFGKKSVNALSLLKHLLKSPIVKVNEVQEITKLTYNSSNKLVSDFIKAGILREITGQKRHRTFAFYEYLALFL